MPDFKPRTSEPELAKDVEIHAPPPATGPEAPEAPETGLSRNADADLARDVDADTGGAARELARAFQANAEALHSIHDVQAELATSLKRSDRSEMMLQSTQALNETFRNLTTIQRQMLSQMQEQQAASRRSPLVPMMLLGLLVVLLGGVYLIIDQLQQARPSMEELAQIRDDNEKGRLEAYRDGQARGMEESGTKVTSLQDEIDRSRMRLLALEQERDGAREDIGELEREKRAAETERDDLADRVIKAQNEAMARRLVEESHREQRAQLLVAKARLEQIEADLERERSEKERLMKQWAAYGLGLPNDEPLVEVRYPDRERPPPFPETPELPVDRPSPSAIPPAAQPEPVDIEDQPTAPRLSPGPAPGGLGSPPAGPGDLPSPTVRSPGASRDLPGAPVAPPELPTAKGSGAFPPPVPPAAGDGAPAAKPMPVDWRRDLSRDVVLTGRIRTVVNRLFAAGSQTTRSKSEWQMTKLGGVTQDILAEVMLLQYDPSGRLVGNIAAQEMRIVADRDEKVVAVILKNGTRVFNRKSEPLPTQGSRLIIAKGDDHVRAWRNSGLVMIHDK